MKILGKEYSFKNLKNNFKDPYFVIKIWQQMAILAFIVGIFIGVVFSQNYYIEQANSVFEQAAEQDGCFENYLNNHKNELWYVKNSSPVNIYNVTDINSEHDK